jgi:hypothetical protein
LQGSVKDPISLGFAEYLGKMRIEIPMQNDSPYYRRRAYYGSRVPGRHNGPTIVAGQVA